MDEDTARFLLWLTKRAKDNIREWDIDSALMNLCNIENQLNYEVARMEYGLESQS